MDRVQSGNIKLVIDCYDAENNLFWSINKIVKLQRIVKQFLKKKKLNTILPVKSESYRHVQVFLKK
jgi:hypothetical protein